MLRLVAWIAAIIGLYFYLNPPLLLTRDVPPMPARVSVTAGPGVSAYDYQMVCRAVRLTDRVVGEKCGLALEHDVKVTVVRDVIDYMAALQREAALDGDSSVHQATSSAGTSRFDRVIINLGALPRHSDAIFVTAHELTHQYQFAGRGDWSRLNWLTEGMADVIAAHVVEADLAEERRAGEAARFRAAWQEAVRADGRCPGLAELDRRQDWVRAMERFGAVVYRRAGTAVFALTEARGYGALASYVKLVEAGMEAETAFAAAFGRTPGAFRREHDEWLARQPAGVTAERPGFFRRMVASP